MGLRLPPRTTRVVTGSVLGAALLVLASCSAEDQDQISRLAMPVPAAAEAPATFELWKWSWVAAMVVGVIVWGLIFYAAFRFRRRSDDEIPVQTRYNLPLEIFYTVAPIMMVVVFFYWTVEVQNERIAMDPEPDVTIEVVGQQWSWTFNHGVGEPTGPADPVIDGDQSDFRYDDYVYTSGTAAQIPTLVLPVDEKVQFNLHSPDVIHSFGIDSFLMKMDVIPGRVNAFQVTPDRIGTYNGKCFELCGTYHSRMLFNVEVVSQEDYAAYLDELAAQGNESATPLLGGSEVRTQAGLESDNAEGEQE